MTLVSLCFFNLILIVIEFNCCPGAYRKERDDWKERSDDWEQKCKEQEKDAKYVSGFVVCIKF